MRTRDNPRHNHQSETVRNLKNLMRAAGLRPSKALGQSFLVLDRIAEEVVSHLHIQENERVLEIGPGFGALTTLLVRKEEEGLDYELTLVEKDRRIAGYLKKRFPDVELIVGDVLKLDLSGFDRLISNLPYGISSPITASLLCLSFKRAVFMYQKEFAERITAGQEEKNYSRLGVKAGFKLNIEELGIYPQSVFYPRPEVQSTLLAFTPHTAPPFAVVDENFFFLVVDVLFAHRRKIIRNCLKQGKQRILQYLDTTLDEIDTTLASLPYLDRRVEELRPEEIGELTDEMMAGSL